MKLREITQKRRRSINQSFLVGFKFYAHIVPLWLRFKDNDAPPPLLPNWSLGESCRRENNEVSTRIIVPTPR
jgi:hypothetical protein